MEKFKHSKQTEESDEPPCIHDSASTVIISGSNLVSSISSSIPSSRVLKVYFLEQFQIYRKIEMILQSFRIPHIQLPIFLFFLIMIFIQLFLAVLGLCCCTGSPLVAVSGDILSSCDVGASHCGGFLNCRAWALGRMCFSSCGMWAQQLQFPGSRTQAQQLWQMGLVAPWHVGPSWKRERTRVSCTGRWILYH